VPQDSVGVPGMSEIAVGIVQRGLLISVLVVTASGVVASVADKPTVTCEDGTTAPGGRGACRGHGGVDKSKSATQAAPAAAPAAAAPAAAAKPTAPTGKTTGKAATTDPAGALAKCKVASEFGGAQFMNVDLHPPYNTALSQIVEAIIRDGEEKRLVPDWIFESPICSRSAFLGPGRKPGVQPQPHAHEERCQTVLDMHRVERGIETRHKRRQGVCRYQRVHASE